MGTLIALVVAQAPAIVTTLLQLFKDRHPTATTPSADDVVKAIEAALSGKRDFGPLEAIAFEQLPQIQQAIQRLFQRQQAGIAPTAVALTEAQQTQLDDAFDASIKDRAHKGNVAIDAWLAAHPETEPAHEVREAQPYTQQLQIFANLLSMPPVGPQSVTITVPAEGIVTVEIHVRPGELSIAYPRLGDDSLQTPNKPS